MFPLGTSSSWLSRVHHDLVKRLVWFARDCKDAGRAPMNGELVAIVYDEEGQAMDATTLWENLCQTAPTAFGLEKFGLAVRACVEAARNNDVPGVLMLETAFERLKESVASSLNQSDSHTKGPTSA